MKLRRFALLVSFALAGCGRPANPENDVLPGGTRAAIVSERPVFLQPEDDLTTVEPGVQVTVGYDPGYFFPSTQWDFEMSASEIEDPKERAKYIAEGPHRVELNHPAAKRRLVRITVDSGPAKGKSGGVSRMNLRPLR